MRHEGPGDRELRARLSELADAAGRFALMPSPAVARRRRSRGRPVRRATAALAVLLGTLAGPAAVGVGLTSFSSGSSSRSASTSPSGTAPPAGRILPPTALPSGAPLPPGAPQTSKTPQLSGQSPSAPTTPSMEPSQLPSGSGTPSATRTPPPALPQQIYLSDGNVRDAAGCARPARAARTIDEYYPALQALRLVLAGPGPNEADRGLRSAPKLAGMTVRTYGVVGTTARVDFNSLPEGVPLPPQSCRKAEVMEPMTRTLVQFPNISDVRFSIQGSETAFYRDLIGMDVPDQ